MRSTFRKKGFALAVILALALAIAGCGGNSVICLHKADAMAVLNAVIIGAEAAMVLMPKDTAIWKTIEAICNEAKSEYAKACPSLTIAENLAAQLAQQSQLAASMGFKLTK
jgi:hypothetical protein